MKKSLSISGAAIIALALANPALAQSSGDVGIFSSSDAEDVLADTEDDECPVRLENGECARTSATRGFSFAPKKSSSGSKAAPSASISRPSSSASVTKSRPNARTTSKPTAAPRSTRAREVPLQFSLGSYELSPQSKENLSTLAKALNSDENKAKRIRITGHTDKSGSLETNERLSQQRADAAAAYLASVGVDRTRIDTEGRAFQDILPGLSAFNPRNRRVEVERVQ